MCMFELIFLFLSITQAIMRLLAQEVTHLSHHVALDAQLTLLLLLLVLVWRFPPLMFLYKFYIFVSLGGLFFICLLVSRLHLACCLFAFFFSHNPSCMCLCRETLRRRDVCLRSWRKNAFVCHRNRHCVSCWLRYWYAHVHALHAHTHTRTTHNTHRKAHARCAHTHHTSTRTHALIDSCHTRTHSNRTDLFSIAHA